MFTQAIKKYFPVIAILLKRTTNEVQVLSMNHTDFERAAGGRKVKCSFPQLQLINGRINTEIKQSPFAKSFGDLLREDKVIQKLLVDKHFEFSMTNDYKLNIKDNTPKVAADTELVTEETIAVEAVAVEEVAVVED
jgi:hypothetical protein